MWWSRYQTMTLADMGRPCVCSYLLSGSWRQQLAAFGRPGGSQMGVLKASGEVGRGSQWMAVALFWEAGDVCSLAFLSMNRKTCMILFIFVR